MRGRAGGVVLPPWRIAHRLAGTDALFDTADDRIALTFDDGPHAERTPAILDLLRAHGAKASFFVVAERAQRHPDLVRRMVEEGHSVENHGLTHRFWPALSACEVEKEVAQAQILITDVIGVRPTLLRPAYGWSVPAADRVARALGLRLCFWSLDALDYTPAPARLVAARLSCARPGDIVLLHDGATRARHTMNVLEHWLERRVPTHLGPVIA